MKRVMMKSVRQLILGLSILCGIISGIIVMLLFSIVPTLSQTPVLAGITTGVIVTLVLFTLCYYTILRV
jgi:lipopolysaccharide export LptBFGC system permease protein LptF